MWQSREGPLGPLRRQAGETNRLVGGGAVRRYRGMQRERALESPPTPRRAGRPSLKRAAELGDVILDEAWACFHRDGYGALTLDGIARSASVSKRTIYDRFGSRAGLLEAMLTRALDGWRAQARFAMDTAGDDWLERFIAHLLDLLAREDVIVMTSLIELEGRTFPDVVATRGRLIETALTHFEGQLRARLPDFPTGKKGRRLARSVLALIHGWATTFRALGTEKEVRPDVVSIAEEARAILRLRGCASAVEPPLRSRRQTRVRRPGIDAV